MENLKNLSKKFKALGNERRLKIVKELLRCKRLTVGEISDKIRLSFRSTSKHLKVLEAVGFVGWKKIGSNIYYFVLPESLKELLVSAKKLIIE